MQDFGEAQAGAVEERGHEPGCVFKLVEDEIDLRPGEDGGETTAAFGADGVDVAEGNAEHLAVEKDEGVHGLVLGGGADAPLGGEPRKEGGDLKGAGFGLARPETVGMERDEAPRPADVGFFCAERVVLEAGFFPEAVDDFLVFHGVALLSWGDMLPGWREIIR